MERTAETALDEQRTPQDTEAAVAATDDADDRSGLRAFCSRHRKVIGCIGIVLAFACVLLFVYRDIVFRGWKLSFTNLQYTFEPFSSLDVSTKGPLLSDPADNVLPIAWVTYHITGFTTWLSSFALGTEQTMSLYLSPLNWLYALDFDVAQMLISIIKFTIAFAGMFCFVRHLGYSWRGSFIAGVSFTFSSAMVMWHGWPHTEVSMYAPWLFLLIDTMLSRIKIRYCLAMAAVVYLMMVPGMPTYAAYFFYLGLCYGVIFCLRTYWGNIKKVLTYLLSCGVPAVCGVLLSLPYTGQVLLSVGTNGYSESRTAQAFASLPIGQLQSLLLPYTDTNGYHLNEATLFTGVLAVLALGLTFLHFRKKPRVGFFFGASCVLLVLIFSNVLAPIFSRLPLINTSLKYRVIILLNFCLSVTLGINLDNLLTKPLESRGQRVCANIAVLVPLLAFITYLYFKLPVIRSSDTHIQLEAVLGLGVAIALYLSVWFRTFSNVRFLTGIATAMLVVGVSVDVGYFASNYLPLIEKEAPSIPQTTSTITYLQQHTSDDSKFVVASEKWSFYQSINMFYGLRDARGHGLVFTNEDLSTYFTSIAETNDLGSPTRPSWSDIDNESLLKSMGVRFVVYTQDEFDELDIAKEHPTWTFLPQDDGMVICDIGDYASQVELIDTAVALDSDNDVLETMEQAYEPNTLYLSEETTSDAATLVENCSSEPLAEREGIEDVQTDESTGAMTFTVTTDADRLVVINEYYSDGWTAYVDGEPTDVYKGNYLFRVIEVPAGTHEVELRYESPTLPILFGIAGGTLVILIVIGAFSSRLNHTLFSSYNRLETRASDQNGSQQNEELAFGREASVRQVEPTG